MIFRLYLILSFCIHSDEKDPFNRSPLKLDQVEACVELQERIHEWMREHGIEQPDLTADDCGG